MDESWRMRMGINLPRRRSTEETSSNGMRRSNFGFNNSSDTDTLDPDDFNDVFGGPPRRIFSQKFSGDFPAGKKPGYFYEEIFRPSEFQSSVNRGRNLPVFRIPTATAQGNGGIGVSRRNEGFYDDIFGSDDDRRSRSRSKSKPNSKSKSKSNSSSVLSSEDLSPLRSTTVADDVGFSSFASKLRPINAPCQWNSSFVTPEDQHNRQGMSAIPSTHPSHMEFHFTENDFNEKNFRSSHFRSSRHVSSPEIISLEPDSYRTIKISVDDLETDSPSSAVSSIGHYPQAKAWIPNLSSQNHDEQEEDEVMSSFVIDISSFKREGTDHAEAIDEAIAWAKEKFQSQSSGASECGNQQNNVRESESEREPLAQTEERPITHECVDQQISRHGRIQFLEADEEPQKCKIEEENQQPGNEMERELLEEEIRLWSSGKEDSIRFLLSSLDQVLWPSSGWCVIPLTSLIETSQVKKAYQKARLCLHPDKLQQRGATLSQKSVAEMVFAILQDAWASFTYRDVILH